MAKALNDIATGLACKLNVVKTRRCSGTGEEAADSLSKGDWEHAWNNMPNIGKCRQAAFMQGAGYAAAPVILRGDTQG